MRFREILAVALMLLCLIAIPVTFAINHSEVGGVRNHVTNIESPCLRYGATSRQCREAFEQAVLTINHAEACAILRKAGLEIANCQGAHLRQERRRRKHRKGVVPQQPSKAHQQPSPPATGGGQGSTDRTVPPAPEQVEQSPPVETPAPASEAAGPTLESVGGLVPELPCVTVAELASVACH